MKAQYTVTVGSETMKQDIKDMVANIKHRTGADPGRILKDALSDYYLKIKNGLSERCQNAG